MKTDNSWLENNEKNKAKIGQYKEKQIVWGGVFRYGLFPRC